MSHAPNAALLIDFDNVTLGIRSDLTKELRTLLNSEIIKGKVAVQRAYADWRRYPQYIVPLSESSIDLIFAPAFGPNKKNATDIRLAVDAIELVFTRPEIGTFILLSGDSDFSTLVIKLKEYGKYVIGVGIRESASDLLIQNCDEYYSYSDLAGLTKEAEPSSIQRDPWEVVREAIARMTEHGDVMRSDRLKQVMQQIDPNFDERNFGFNRFSKFVIEAGNRGALRLTKLDNGQFEVGPMEALPATKTGSADDGARRGRRGGRGRGSKAAKKKAAPQPTKDTSAARPGPSAGHRLSLAKAFDLLRQALEEMDLPAPSAALRLRMATLHGREDQLLEEGRFQRLLRQAHDAHVAEVRKLEDGSYEVNRIDGVVRGVSPSARTAESEPPAESPAKAPEQPETDEREQPNGRRAGLRFRRGSRTPARKEQIPMVGVVAADDGAGAAAGAGNAKSDKKAKSAKKKRPARKKKATGGTKKKKTTRKRAKAKKGTPPAKQDHSPPSDPSV